MHFSVRLIGTSILTPSFSRTSALPERLETALKRKIPIYGLLTAAAITGGCAQLGHYDTRGDQTGRAISQVLQEAGLKPSAVDQISVAANYNGELDEVEYRQLKSIFGEKQQHIGVVPLKYLLGEFGGAGALRAAASLLSLSYQMPLPEIGLKALNKEDRDPIDWRMPSIEHPKVVLMTSTSLGGASSSLIFTTHESHSS